MKKRIRKFFAIFMVVLLLLPTVKIQPVFAESALADGEYTIGFRVLKNGTEDTSTMDGYTVKPAGLTVQNGKTYVSVTLKSSEWIKTFQVERNGEYVDAEVVSTNEAENTRVVKFEVDDLTKKLNVQTRVAVPGVYDTVHTVQFLFDVNSITPVQAEQPEEGGQEPENPGQEDGEEPKDPTPGDTEPNPQPGEDGNQDEQPAEQLQDGEYTIGFRVLKNGTEDTSTMDGYTVKPAGLTVQDGKKYVSVTLKSSEWIKTFQVERNGEYVDAEVVSTNETENTRVVKFEVDDLTKKLNVQTRVAVPGVYDTVHTVQFLFDVDSITPVQDGQPEEGGQEPENPGQEDGEEPNDPAPGEDGDQDEQPAEQLQDGEYTIDLTVFKNGTDDISSMDNYTEKPARLTVQDGKKYVLLTLKSSSLIKSFKVERNGEYVDAEVVSTNVEKNTRVVKFEVDDLTKKLNAQLTVSVPNMYEMTHTVQFKFDVDSITPVQAEQPEEGGQEPENPGQEDGEEPNDPAPGDNEPNPQPGEDGDQDEQPAEELQDGEYTIDFKVLKDKTEDISMMDGYTVKPARLSVKDGKKYVSVTLKNSGWIKSFQVERNGQYVDAEVVSTNDVEDTRVVKFEVDDLTKKLNVQTRVVIPQYGYDGSYTVQIQFDVDSIKPVKKDQPDEDGQKPEDPGKDPGTNKPGDNPSNNNNQNSGNNNGGQTRNELADGLYTVEFTVLKNGTEEPSMVNDYVVSPALLTVKNGQLDVAFTLLKSSWITKLQVERNGQYQDVEVRSKNEKEDTRVVGFPIEDLSKKVNAKIKVDIPDLQYHNTYDIQIAFDPDSVKPYDGTDVPTRNTNSSDQDQNQNQDQNLQNSNSDDDSLTFNRDADQQSTDDDASNNSNNSTVNAKTADLSQIGLYLALLLGSLAIIVWKNRSRLLIHLKK
ncbi:NEAT domain-containing protein [Aeribacillus sp. FSL K6-1121]|uniref:NEAT domain-containing protein n=1 Tax=Aeribacillus sp. FSL K6-1121 TaxID=2954745 RepID=UPI0030F8C9FA